MNMPDLKVQGTATSRWETTMDERTRKSARKPGALLAFADAYGSSMLATKDPRTELFIKVMGVLGLEEEDLHNADMDLLQYIHDAVKRMDDLEMIPGVDYSNLGQPKQPTPYGIPATPSDKVTGEKEKVRVELDTWDLMAGHTKARDPFGEPKEKEQWKPDAIDPTIDPMEEIRRIGGKGGH